MSHDIATAPQDGVAVPREKAIEDAIYRKITWRLIPLLFLAYFMAFLDRINVGYAKLQMSADLGFSEAVYGLGAGLFFITYLLFEVPSNLWLEKVGVRVTLLRIMVLWGLVSASTMFVTTPEQFYAVRLLLGICEAGFFPGIILYLTYWYPTTRRGKVTGQFMLAIPLAGIIGGPVSGWIIAHMDGLAGLSGWQWMFLVEGLPASVLGVVCFFCLADTPAKAKWLTPQEKKVVEAVMQHDNGGAAGGHDRIMGKLLVAALDIRVWLLAFIYFTTACANYTFTFWLPTMVRGLGVTDVGAIGLYSAIPYVFAALGVILVSASSDRRRERRWHVGGSLIIGAVGLASTPFLTDSLLASLVVLSFVAFFQFGAGIAYWAIPSTYLGKANAAVGIGLVSSIGVFGGFVSPSLLGFIKDLTGNLDNGIFTIAVLMLAGGLAILLLLPARAVRVG
ncbi:MFS transporter [Stutzerimonas nosocomialis]|uniref:MFS transporter n=1 Tax=Stutzerimonas nosocomialis TaxID=1056496 RepID=UPI001107D32A|nr:MFS transporter [Stutzerimonas nosocomialis]TLX56239.1 MFS transporter [Stutzerimonas nosocomialis]TLX58567.1 MFS transporter [Stutzerimonas nosocomialis]